MAWWDHEELKSPENRSDRYKKAFPEEYTNMGKRSDFQRIDKDFYPTPMEAVLPLLPHLKGKNFMEPCAGDGQLVDHLREHGQHCVLATDIEPRGKYVLKKDATQFSRYEHMKPHIRISDYFITNPPWSRQLLHPMIDELSNLLPTWLLFDADWMHTKQSAPYMDRCEKIVSVGRVKWIPDSTMVGKDNCCWYLFQKNTTGKTRFYGRS